MSTAPRSALCDVLTEDVARQISPGMAYLSQTAPVTGKAPEVCAYADAAGRQVSLMPASRPFATEVALAQELARNPGSGGMNTVRVNDLDRLGDGGFSEVATVKGQDSTVVFVVWHVGSRAWVVTVSVPGESAQEDQAVAIARQISPQLPT
jgi:hypothetical protein